MNRTATCPQCGNSVEPARISPALGIAVIFLAVSLATAGVIVATVGANAAGLSHEALSAVMWSAAIVCFGGYTIFRWKMIGDGKRQIYYCRKCKRGISGDNAGAI
jgi:hypothetical protein